MSQTVREEAADGPSATTVRPDRIEATARVRDFDQLSESEQRAFTADGPVDVSAASDLERGDVIRFTDYYRIL